MPTTMEPGRGAGAAPARPPAIPRAREPGTRALRRTALRQAGDEGDPGRGRSRSRPSASYYGDRRPPAVRRQAAARTASRVPGGNGLGVRLGAARRPAVAGGRGCCQAASARENLAAAVRITHATAVDVSSGVERAPGIKDPEKIGAFLAGKGALVGGLRPSLLAQPGDNLRRMLAQRRRGKARLRRLVAEPDHRRQMLAARGVGDHHAAGARLFVIDGLAQRLHRREADIAAAEPVDPLRLAALGEDALRGSRSPDADAGRGRVRKAVPDRAVPARRAACTRTSSPGRRARCGGRPEYSRGGRRPRRPACAPLAAPGRGARRRPGRAGWGRRRAPRRAWRGGCSRRVRSVRGDRAPSARRRGPAGRFSMSAAAMPGIAGAPSAPSVMPTEPASASTARSCAGRSR